MASLPADPTLDEIRAHLAPILPTHAAFDGWSTLAIDRAAEQAGLDPGIARLAFPSGAIDMIDAWFASVDHKMTATLTAEQLAGMKVRQRITALVNARIDAVAHEREALRRAIAILAMPRNLARAAKLSWRSSDLMWRLAGDKATDYNHYTKRMMLSGVYGSTILVLLDDESEGFTETRAFLDRRIENIMQFERAKGRFLEQAERRPSLSRFVGRLRYPAV